MQDVSEGRHYGKRRVTSGLSERQREVLQLIAEGKTNGEIAEALGIGLSGAKYHVSELLDIVGVDSRDELADWWRARNGLRARISGIVRTTRLRAIGLASATSAAVAAGGVVAWQLLSEADAPLPSGALLAAAKPLSPPTCRGTGGNEICLPEHEQVVLVDASGAYVRELGDPGNWGDLAWSADGRNLAAIDLGGPDLQENELVLHVFDVEDGGHHLRPLGTGLWSGGLRWSPDGSRLVLTVVTADASHVVIVDAAGDEVASLQAEGSAYWSDDGLQLVLVHPTTLQLFDRDGVPQLTAVPDETALALSVPASPLRWDPFVRIDDGTITAGLMVAPDPEDGGDQDTRAWEVRGELGHGNISWLSVSELQFSDRLRDHRTRLTVDTGLTYHAATCLRDCLWHPDGAIRGASLLMPMVGAPAEASPDRQWYAAWETDSDTDLIPLPLELRNQQISMDVTYRDP